MVETISHQRARRLVTVVGWLAIKNGQEAYSRDMLWVVYAAGDGLYRRRPCEPHW